MGAALLAIALWVHVGVRRSLLDQLDRSIHSTSRLQGILLAETGSIIRIPPADPRQIVADVNRVVVVRDSAGSILQANTQLARELPFDSERFAAALAGGEDWAEADWDQGTVRVLSRPVPAGSPPGSAVLQVGASLAPTEAAARRILMRMVGTALLGSLFTLAGAWWLCRKAIAPVAAIAAEAQEIQGHIGDRRITVHANVHELKGLVEVLNRMLSRVASTQEWHRRILQDLGHDLRTPLTAMRGAIEVALRKPRPVEEYQRVLQSTQEDIDRLQLITDSLSLLGQIESGSLKPRLAPVDIRILLKEAVDRAQGRLDGHLLELSGLEEPVQAPLDRQLMDLTLDQLIDNAVQHTPQGTRIRIGLSRHQDRAQIEVEDNGPGVAPEVLPSLFDRFYRGSTSRSRQSGAGLGLTTVAAVVALHHGTVRAEAGTEGGLRVRLELPTGN